MSGQPVLAPLITVGDPASADVCVDGWCGPADARPETEPPSDDPIERLAAPPVVEYLPDR